MKQVWFTADAPLDGMDRKHKEAGGQFYLVGITESGNARINTEPKTTGIISLVPMRYVLQEVDLWSTDGLSQTMKDHFRSGKPIYQQGLPFPDGTVILRAGTDSGSLMNVISVHQVIELDDLSDALSDLTSSSLSR